MRIIAHLLIVAGLIATGVAGSAARAQSPAFEVATVRVNRSGENAWGFPALANGTLNARNVSMRTMLRAAYDLSESRIIGPDWLDSDRFDLAGKAPRPEAPPGFSERVKIFILPPS